jgi:hypothetical protein
VLVEPCWQVPLLISLFRWRPQDKKHYGFGLVRFLGHDLSGDKRAWDPVLARGRGKLHTLEFHNFILLTSCMTCLMVRVPGYRTEVYCASCEASWINICSVEESRPTLWSTCQSSWPQNGDVLCFLWGANWIYVCYLEEIRPPLLSRGQSSWLQNGEALSFLWGTNWIYICYVEESRPPLWSCGQSSWLQNGDVLFFLWGTDWIYICY